MRRRKSGLLTSLIVCSILTSGLGRDIKWRRTRKDWDGYLRGMPRSHFSRMFRMDHDTFMHILHTVGPHLSRNFHQSERSGGFVSPSLQLGMTIRWLAGGSYLDIHDSYGVSKSTFYRLVFQCCEVITEKFPIVFPTDVRSLERLARDFSKRQHWYMRVFKGVIGAIDGILIKIRCPSTKEVGMPKHYFCRKGFFALNVQAICDVRYRFTFVSMDMPGATHDARAFSFSALFEALNAGMIPAGFYFLGDAAYRGIRQILAPFIGNQSARESVFSFYHSSVRMAIECAFGQLVSRWGILWRPLRVPLRHAPVVVETCMCLHNILIDRNVPVEIRPPVVSRSRGASMPTARPHINNNGGPGSLLSGDGAGGTDDTSNMSALREFITVQMGELEMKRPATSIERMRIQSQYLYDE